MNKFLAILAAAFILTHAGIASAAEASGKVMTIDDATRTIVLEDGTAVTVPAAISLDGLKPGATVTIAYEVDGGKNVATDVATDQ